MGFAVVLMLCIGIVGRVTSNLIGTYVNKACGGENSCYSKGNSSWNSLPKDSCCRPCECDQICLEKGSCCENVVFNIPEKITMQKCLPAVKLPNNFDNSKVFNRYFVRTVCPDTFKNQSIRQKCEKDEPETLNDIIFVSSMDGKVVYKNRYCAECFGEEGFIIWDVELDQICMKETFNLGANASFILKKLMTVCFLSFVRPSVTDPRYTLCHVDEQKISSCRENKGQDQLTEQFKSMCLNDTSPLTFYKESLHTKVYANVYCYLCNARAQRKCDLDDRLKSPGNFLFLLDPRPITEEGKMDTTQHFCDHAEVYDNYFDVCRRLECPVFEVPVRGECVTLISSSIMNYIFHFEIILTSQRPLEQDFLNTLFHTLPSALGFRGCESCRATFHSNLTQIQNSTGRMLLYFKYVLMTSSNCTRDRVLSHAARLEERKKLITFVDENVLLKVKYIWPPEDYEILTKTFRKMYNFNKGCKYLIPSRFEHCPKVTVSLEDYTRLTNKSLIWNAQTIRAPQENIKLCLEDYKQLLDRVTSGGGNWRPSCPSVVLCILLCILSVRWLNVRKRLI